jgi:predicted small secreted protein
MTRSLKTALLVTPLLLAGCNVTDNGNGSSTISVDQNKIDRGADVLANEASKAGAEATNAIKNAGPELKKSAADIQERAGRVADKADNINVDIDLNTADDKPASPPPASKK